MLLVIDIGNTRVKWALADAANLLNEQGACIHADITESRLMIAAKKATKVFVANVAGETILNKIKQLMPSLTINVLQVTNNACGVENLYEQPQKLGADRWAAAVAAWQLTQTPTIIVNTGTAVTIDSLNIVGCFLGGTIQPGLRLMHESLNLHTVNLKLTDEKRVDLTVKPFPKNTADAVFAGGVNAIVGAILLQMNAQTQHYGKPPCLILSGGDADLIAQALNQTLKQALKFDAKQVIIAQNLVLQGLVLLERAHA